MTHEQVEFSRRGSEIDEHLQMHIHLRFLHDNKFQIKGYSLRSVVYNVFFILP